MTSKFRSTSLLRRAALVAGAAGAAILLAASAASAGPDTVSATPMKAATFNGEIFATIYSGSTIYVGGDFTTATFNGATVTRSHVAAIDATTGALLSWAPSVDSTVRALAVSGNLVYLGGAFSHVNGAAHKRLAAVDTGGVVTSFTHTPNNLIRTMAVSGGRLYIGGNFTTVDGATRNRLAAFSTTTGALDTGWNPGADDEVDAITPYGGQIYLGGLFTQIGGVGPPRIHTVDPVDAHTVTTFKGAAAFQVIGIFVDTTGVYVAVGGPGGRAMAFTPTGVARWTITTDGNAQAIAVLGNTVYVGGHFASVCRTANTGAQGLCLDGKTDVGKIFAVDLNGVLQPWQTNVRGIHGVHQIDINTSLHTIAVGGDWTTVGGKSVPDFVQFG